MTDRFTPPEHYGFEGEEPETARAPREPSDAMLIAARDWSMKKYGKPIGNDDAKGCWQAMFDAIAD